MILQPIELLAQSELLARIDADIAETTAVDAYVYTANADYLKVVFGPLLNTKPVRIIVDWKHRSELANLQDEFPYLAIRAYATNRTMHDKTFLLHGGGVVYLLTANMNRGSFLLSKNRCVRVTQEQFYFKLAQDFESDWKHCSPLPRRHR
jgi:hypothetical protein